MERNVDLDWEIEENTHSMEYDRLKQQIEFVIEIDKLKRVLRKTILMDGSRQENAAEHSWHLAVMAIFLSEYAGEKRIDLLRVLKMLLIHDIVEIDAGICGGCGNCGAVCPTGAASYTYPARDGLIARLQTLVGT